MPLSRISTRTANSSVRFVRAFSRSACARGQYLILARDHDNVLEKRVEVRPDHLKHVSKYKASGNFVTGGATLNEEGKPEGSFLIYDFSDTKEFEEAMQNDPYVTKGVWGTISLVPVKLATQDIPEYKGEED
eukprot:Clim_evm89s152 gene=Clim_evmTU89s152